VLPSEAVSSESCEEAGQTVMEGKRVQLKAKGVSFITWQTVYKGASKRGGAKGKPWIEEVKGGAD
jgi:hypothetical protein